MIGTKMSRYTIEAPLGRGGMGEVYRARDERLGRSVAIKLLPPAAAGDPDRLRRFTLEAKAASGLNHPNIVTIHDIDEHESVPFIVMEHVDGKPLSAMLGQPLAVGEFLDYAVQITSALAAAHEANIVHRDIKPANVMVGKTGQVKVVDFGLARLLTPAESVDRDAPTAAILTARTRPGHVVGTLGYMSPEQVEGHQVDARSDVFSLGVLFHEMLSGKALFSASSPVGTMSAVLRDDPPRLDTLRDDVPAELSGIVSRCLAKRAEERYANAGEVYRDLVKLRESRERTSTRSGSGKAAVAGALVVLAVVAALAGLWWRGESKRRWVRNTAIPEIHRLAAAEDTFPAYVLMRRAMAIAPDDPQLQQAMANLSMPLEIRSEPPGATVRIRSYTDGGEWLELGTTPTGPVRWPGDLVRIRIEREGYVPLEVAPEPDDDTMTFRLHRPDEVPAGMVAVPAGAAAYHGQSVALPEFWVDQYEVSNREFKRFVDEGGYRRPELWKHPIVKDGATLSFDAAMKEFVDQTGRTGPSQWTLGSYPDGAEEKPVEGISWYEAAAYAEFVGKTLPTVFHWARYAGIETISSDILKMSNIASSGTVVRGDSQGLGPFGTYDTAGNVKEWTLNPTGPRRYLLGGAWYDPVYQFLEPDAQFPIARREGFGLRLIQTTAPLPEEAQGDFTPARPPVPAPVDDATYATLARHYDYDPLPLNAKTEERDDSHAAWRRERVVIDAAYGGERLPMLLFLPKNASPPYQTIVYFPSSDAAVFKSSAHPWMRVVDFFVRSGRAVVYPVYKGTYERQVPAPQGPIARRDLRVQRVKDVRRVVDYLVTRNDIDGSRLLYYGVSFGASHGPFALATEPRFKAAILFAGGLGSATGPPENQMQNFLPRVTLPVLFITGRHDFVFPYEASQLPYFDLLGTPPDRKRHLLLEGGHLPPQYNEYVREMLAWADRWLGAVGG